jgi:AcrR family transcriptional regulator
MKEMPEKTPPSIKTRKKNRSPDQRQSMKWNVLQAFENLLLDAAYSEIGVNRICAAAHISKPTFYRYFQSKEDIVCWLSQEAIRCGVAEIGRKFTWTEGYYRTLSVIKHYKVFYADPKSPAFTNPLESFCAEHFKLTLFETLTKDKGIVLTRKLRFQIDAFAQLQSTLLQQWAFQDFALSTETFTDYLCSVVPHDLYVSLDEPTENK